MGQITADQSQGVMATLMANVNWSSVDFELDNLQNAVRRDPVGVGKRFTAFLKNECRMFNNVQDLFLAKKLDVAKFLGDGWRIWKGPADGDGLTGKEDVDLRSINMSEIELTKFVFKTCIRAGEESITGEEKLRRQKEEMPEFIRFGGSVFLNLWEDYEANKDNCLLEKLHKTFGITYMDFFGLVLRNPHGNRSILYLTRKNGSKWYWDYSVLIYEWTTSNPSVGCSS